MWKREPTGPGVRVLVSSAGSTRGCLSCAPRMRQFQSVALHAYAAPGLCLQRRMDFASHSNWKRRKYKIKDIFPPLQRGKAGCQALRKSRNDSSWNKNSVSNGESSWESIWFAVSCTQSLSALLLIAASLISQKKSLHMWPVDMETFLSSQYTNFPDLFKFFQKKKSKEKNCFSIIQVSSTNTDTLMCIFQ